MKDANKSKQYLTHNQLKMMLDALFNRRRQLSIETTEAHCSGDFNLFQNLMKEIVSNDKARVILKQKIEGGAYV